MAASGDTGLKLLAELRVGARDESSARRCCTTPGCMRAICCPSNHSPKYPSATINFTFLRPLPSQHQAHHLTPRKCLSCLLRRMTGPSSNPSASQQLLQGANTHLRNRPQDAPQVHGKPQYIPFSAQATARPPHYGLPRSSMKARLRSPMIPFTINTTMPPAPARAVRQMYTACTDRPTTRHQSA